MQLRSSVYAFSTQSVHTGFSVKVTLPRMPNELLDDIITYLEPGDMRAVLCSTWDLHDVAARQLYRRVVVSNNSAKRFFKTLIESREDYGQYTRTLRYTASSSNDVHLTHLLLCEAIPRLRNLERMSLTVRASLAPFLRYLLKKSVRYSTVYTSTNANIEFDERDSTSILSCVEPNFPKLKILHLHGDIRLLKRLHIWSLTRLCITDELDNEDFDLLIRYLTPGDLPNLALEALIITLDYTGLRSDIVVKMYRLGVAFPNIRMLTIRTPNINAMEVSQLLTLKPPIFPGLTVFRLNEWSVVDPVFASNGSGVLVGEDDLLSAQREHIIEAENMRPNLHSLGFGVVQWRKEASGDQWTNRRECVLTSHDEDCYPNLDQDNLLWRVFFMEPDPLPSPTQLMANNSGHST